MSHQHVYGFCESKCKVEVPSLEIFNDFRGGAEIPLGITVPYAGANAPNNWMVCNGASLSVAEYPELYAVIGNTYGGNSTNFNIPNLQGRVPIGVSDTHVLGSTGGEETHILTVDEIPSHNHVYNSNGANSSSSGTWYFNGAVVANIRGNRSDGISKTGGDQPHNNMQPYLTLNYIIKVK